MAALVGDVDIARLLLATGSIEVTDGRGRYSAHHATRNNSVDFLRWLAEQHPATLHAQDLEVASVCSACYHKRDRDIPTPIATLS